MQVDFGLNNVEDLCKLETDERAMVCWTTYGVEVIMALTSVSLIYSLQTVAFNILHVLSRNRFVSSGKDYIFPGSKYLDSRRDQIHLLI